MTTQQFSNLKEEVKNLQNEYDAIYEVDCYDSRLEEMKNNLKDLGAELRKESDLQNFGAHHLTAGGMWVREETGDTFVK